MQRKVELDCEYQSFPKAQRFRQNLQLHCFFYKICFTYIYLNSEYVIVEDVEGKDAFDKAVVGVDAVMHTASPFHFDTADKGVYQTLINPAVNGKSLLNSKPSFPSLLSLNNVEGTLNLLNSAKLEKKISRVVITSSYGQ